YGAFTNFGRVFLGHGCYLSLERQRHQIRDGSWYSVEELREGHFVSDDPRNGQETSFTATRVIGTERDQLWNQLDHGVIR
ncbi:hypothetical protein, partial [Glutamicibacter sp. NPDC087673]|uniref:hypothetical protein n=1 Tax=Glutamicibacter sp. NPDC087673 TaxID=3363997 RepID=UPI0037FF2B1E